MLSDLVVRERANTNLAAFTGGGMGGGMGGDMGGGKVASGLFSFAP